MVGRNAVRTVCVSSIGIAMAMAMAMAKECPKSRIQHALDYKLQYETLRQPSNTIIDAHTTIPNTKYRIKYMYIFSYNIDIYKLYTRSIRLCLSLSVCFPFRILTLWATNTRVLLYF